MNSKHTQMIHRQGRHRRPHTIPDQEWVVHLKRLTECAFGNVWRVRAVLGCEEEIQ